MQIVIQCTPEEARALFQGGEIQGLAPKPRGEQQAAGLESTGLESTGLESAEVVRKDALRFFEEMQQLTQTGEPGIARARALEPVIADGFTLIDHEGRRIGKKQAIEDLSNPRTEFGGFDRSEQMVQVYPAAHVAVQTSLISMAGEIRGKDIKGRFVDTTVLARTDEGWQVVASHLSPVVDPLAASLA